MKPVAKHRSLRALLLVLALLAAACSGTDDSAPVEAGASDDAMTDDSESEDAMADEASDEDAMADDSDSDDAMADDESDDGAASDDDGDTAPVSGPPASLPPEEAQAAAEQNIPNLQPSDDVRDIEVVSVYDGSITSLREVVAGDRPVLLWFWAPH